MLEDAAGCGSGVSAQEDRFEKDTKKDPKNPNNTDHKTFREPRFGTNMQTNRHYHETRYDVLYTYIQAGSNIVQAPLRLKSGRLYNRNLVETQLTAKQHSETDCISVMWVQSS